MSVSCFWIEPTNKAKLYLRRYRCPSHGSCPDHGYHTAMVLIGETGIRVDAVHNTYSSTVTAEDYDGDPRWPESCSCGEPFIDGDVRQAFIKRLYFRPDTGEEMTLDEAPPGAMWDADWSFSKGPDGRCLTVKTPDGFEWMIDGPANNCTLPDDNEHRCWLRTGEPPRITVGKSAPGQRTCRAGAGSIGTPGYHGFLTNGIFT